MHDLKIICITGKAGSGKDTVAQIMRKSMEQAGHTVLVIHFADQVKFVA